MPKATLRALVATAPPLAPFNAEGGRARAIPRRAKLNAKLLGIFDLDHTHRRDGETFRAFAAPVGELAWAEQQASEHGMTPAQVQLGLEIRAHPDPAGPTLTELAATLLLRHRSVVGSVDRAVAGLVERTRDGELATRVHVTLTALGGERLGGLHLRWLTEHGDVWSPFAREPT